MAQNIFNTDYLIKLSPDDLKGLSGKELKSATNQIIAVARKRYQRGFKTWGDAWALADYARAVNRRARIGPNGEVFPITDVKQSIRGKTDAQIREEFRIAQKFLKEETSTEQGRNKTKKKIERYLNEPLTVPQFREVFDAFNKIKEMDASGALNAGGDKYRYTSILKKISGMVKSKQALKNILEEVDEMYSEFQTRERDFDNYLKIIQKRKLSNADRKILAEYQIKYGWNPDGGSEV